MAVSATEQHEFSVGTHPTLVARSAMGTLTVTAGPAGQVQVRVTKRARASFFEHAAESDLEQVHVAVTQEGDSIRIEAEGRGGSLFKHVQVDLDVILPATSDLDLHLAAGNASLQGCSGIIQAEVNAGNLDVRETMLADGSRMAVHAGKVTVRSALQPGASVAITVNAGNADLRMPASTATTLDAHTTVGSLSVNGWPLQVRRQVVAQSAHGALGAEPSGTLTIRVQAGNIAVSRA